MVLRWWLRVVTLLTLLFWRMSSLVVNIFFGCGKRRVLRMTWMTTRGNSPILITILRLISSGVSLSLLFRDRRMKLPWSGVRGTMFFRRPFLLVVILVTVVRCILVISIVLRWIFLARVIFPLHNTKLVTVTGRTTARTFCVQRPTLSAQKNQTIQTSFAGITGMFTVFRIDVTFLPVKVFIHTHYLLKVAAKRWIPDHGPSVYLVHPS